MNQLVALGIDVGLRTTAFSGMYCDGDLSDSAAYYTDVFSVCRPTSGRVHSALMMKAVRQDVEGFIAPALRDALRCAVPALVVATELLAGLRGPAENLLGVHWALLEGIVSGLCNERVPSTAPSVRLLLPAPSQLKKFVSGSGKTRKSELGGYIARRWPDAPAPEDQAEAYALMMFALCRFDCEFVRSSPRDWPQFQLELATRDLSSQAKRGKLHTEFLSPGDARDHLFEFQRAMDRRRAHTVTRCGG